jgi:hypothetical protein
MKKFEGFDPSLGLNAPQFPGQQVKNISIDQVRTLIKKQRRIKGYSFVVPTGQTEYPIQLSGTARILLGIALLPVAVLDPNDPTASNSNPFPYITGFRNVSNVSFKVNNEIVIENVNPTFLTNFLNTDEYNYLPRPLSGTDEITLVFNNPSTAEVVNVAIYYI